MKEFIIELGIFLITCSILSHTPVWKELKRWIFVISRLSIIKTVKINKEKGFGQQDYYPDVYVGWAAWHQLNSLIMRDKDFIKNIDEDINNKSKTNWAGTIFNFIVRILGVLLFILILLNQIKNLLNC